MVVAVLVPNVVVPANKRLELTVISKANSALENALKQLTAVQITQQTTKSLANQTHSPTAILYDLQLGTDQLAMLVSQFPNTAIIGLIDETFTQNSFVSELFSLGLNDYLELSEITDTLLEKIIQKAIYRLEAASQANLALNTTKAKFEKEQSPPSTQIISPEQQKLIDESSFRAELHTLMRDILSTGQNEGIGIYQTMLEKAVAIIPGAQAGSVVLQVPDGYEFVAAVGFNLDILSSILFDIKDFKNLDWTEPKITKYDDAWEVVDYYKRDVFARSGPVDKIKAALSIPIIKDDNVVVIFNLDNFDTEDAFNESSTSMAQMFATQVGALWQRIQLEETLRYEQRKLAHEASFRAELNSLMGDVLSQSSDEKIYQSMLEKAVEIISGAEAGSMAILTKTGYRFVAAVGFNLKILASTIFDLKDFRPPENWSEPILKSYFEEDWYRLDKHKQDVFINAGPSDAIQSSLSIPIFKDDDIVVIFNLDSLTSENAFDDASISMSQMFATQVEALWQRFELEKNLVANENRYRELFIDADRSNKELELLDKLQHAIANKLELNDLYETVAKTITHTFNFTTVAIGLIKGDSVIRVATYGKFDKDAIPVLPVNQGITAKVIQSQKAELVEILSEHPDVLDKHNKRNSSLLATPFFTNQKILGILYIENTDRKLQQADLELIQKVIDQLELAIENAYLHEQVKAELARMHALHKINQSIHEGHDLKDLTQQVIQITRDTVNARWAILYKIDFKNKIIEHIVTSEVSKNPLNPLNFDQLQNGLTGWAIEHQELVFIANGTDDTREHDDVRQARLELGFGSVIVAPLIYQNEALGVMALINHIDDVDYNDSDIQMVRQVSSQASLALAQHQLRQKIEYQAFHDVVTGLPNRFLFEDRLKQTLAHAERYDCQFAVLFLDLDGFKHVNDTLGHDIGDLLLTEVGNRLSKIIRKSDTLARMGGDEFAIILNKLENNEDAIRIAQTYQLALQEVFIIEEQTLFIGGSIGISNYPKDGQDISTLLKHADTAMYEAKALGKNRVQSFSQNLADRNLEKLELETRLRETIKATNFELYYQPKIDLDSGQCIGSEALIRWFDPVLGFVSPEKFIPIAEENGLITILGNWITNEACRQTKAWHKAGLLTTTAINISSIQFEHPHFALDLKQALERHNLEPQYLQLEVTESMVMQDVDIVIQRLQELRELGVSIAIDDFGTGYSSLSYLQNLPLDNLKIDRSFVDLMDKHEHQKNLVQTIISLASNFNLNVIAEGVETETQINLLKEMGCQTAQGYYFSKPVSAKEAMAVMQSFGTSI